MGDSDKLDEAVTRLRRIETRLTRYLSAIGHDTGARKVTRVREDLIAPGYHTTLSDLFSMVGPTERGFGTGFCVYIGDDHIATIFPIQDDPDPEED